MELQALIVLCGVGVVGAAVVLLMGLFSASGTSYEEAIAQQRKATTELLALADNKGKSKKSSKKANKKLAKKEKNKETAVTGSEPESETQAEGGVDEDTIETKPHVEFSPPVVVELPTDTPPNIKIRKRGKDPKVKPILLNKEDPSCVSDPSVLPSETSTVSNHFEEMHPKDEFELLHSTLAVEKATEKKEEKEAVEKKENKAAKQAKGKSATKQTIPAPIKEEHARERRNSGDPPKEQRKAKKVEKKTEETTPAVEEVVVPLNAPQPSELTTDKLLKQALAPAAPVPAPSPPGKNKKKKAEPNVLALIAPGSGGGVAVSELVRVVRDAALSRNEIQILTDALLNKHHDTLPEHSEWTEGPNDPMQKLKKQLADKEKALADEIEASQALHAKLKELRASLNAERGRATSTARVAEQAAAAARAEMHTLQTRLQRLLDDNHALAQDKLMLQSKLGVEGEAQAQRVQMEMHIQRLSESEAALMQQLAALQAELSARVLEAGQARCDAAAARDSIMLAQQHAADLAQQLQEANRAYAELEQKRQHAAHAEQLAKQDARQAQERLAGMTELQNEVERLRNHMQTAEGNADQLKEEMEKQKTQLSNEISSLREQLRSRETELAELKQLKAVPAQNGLPPSNDLQKGAELAKVESVVESLRAELAAAQRASADQREQLAGLSLQLQQHRDKNDELRTKNWKVMEALQTAEKALQAKSASSLRAQDTTPEAVAKAEELHYVEVVNVLRAVCPSAAPSTGPGKEWLRVFAGNLKKELEKKEAEKKNLESKKKQLEEEMAQKLHEKELAKNQLRKELETQLEREKEKRQLETAMKKTQMHELEKIQIEKQNQSTLVEDSRLHELTTQNEHLQNLVDKYKRIIDDTEGVLSRLQQNVTTEEQRWAQQLSEKQRELDDLQQRTVMQMQKKIDALQSELQQKQTPNCTSLPDKRDMDVLLFS